MKQSSLEHNSTTTAHSRFDSSLTLGFSLPPHLSLVLLESYPIGMAPKEDEITSPRDCQSSIQMALESDTIKMEPAADQTQTELKRGFKNRHVNMFAIAGSIGTGLIIGSGSALASGGPGSILIAYCIMGACVYTIMTAFAEMAIFAPMNKGFSGYATRFVDPALGFVCTYYLFVKKKS